MTTENKQQNWFNVIDSLVGRFGNDFILLQRFKISFKLDERAFQKVFNNHELRHLKLPYRAKLIFDKKTKTVSVSFAQLFSDYRYKWRHKNLDQAACAQFLWNDLCNFIFDTSVSHLIDVLVQNVPWPANWFIEFYLGGIWYAFKKDILTEIKK